MEKLLSHEFKHEIQLRDKRIATLEVDLAKLETESRTTRSN
jgi:hypothetical protein